MHSPSDKILLDIKEYAENFFEDNPERSWISFDIDNNKIYNAFHKESDGGLFFDYGNLRRLTAKEKQELEKTA